MILCAMRDIRMNLLHYLYSKTARGGFVALYALEIEFALSGAELGALLEDLKEEELVVEAPEGFQVSPGGVNFARTRWA